MDDERKWRNRLLLYTGARAFGIAVMLLGIAIIYSDLLREGGWPRLGAVIAIAGVIDALFAPRLLKKHWDELDREQP
jgi:hypothetical protein